MTMKPFFAAVIVENVDHPEARLHVAQRQRHRVAGAHLMLIGERLADDGVFPGAQFALATRPAAARKKLNFRQIVMPTVSAEPSSAGWPS